MRALLLLLAFGASACRAPGSPVARDWDPLAAAESPCGRYTLRLEHADWTEERGRSPELSLQFTFRPGEPDVLLPLSR